MGRKLARSKSPEWQTRLREARVREDEIRERARAAGLTLQVSTVTFGSLQFPHWVFRDGKRHVLHYWPTKGNWRDVVTEEKGTDADVEDALLLAIIHKNPGKESPC